MFELGFPKEIKEFESNGSGYYNYVEFTYFDPHHEEWKEKEAVKVDESRNYIVYRIQPGDWNPDTYTNRKELKEERDSVEVDKVAANIELEEFVSRILNQLHS
ncbi:MAG: hypothetical protein ABEJ56_00405 [Candidatus Nanohaloarchaea archaeon]